MGVFFVRGGLVKISLFMSKVCIKREVLYFQLLIPPKRFDFFSPRLGDAQKV